MQHARRHSIATLAALLPLLLLLTACQSGRQPGSSSQASVRIEGASREQVIVTTKAVFAEDGYALTQSSPSELVFQRQGTRRDALKYGGWFGEGVVMRVIVRLSSLGDGAQIAQADVKAVRDASDPFFEDESRAMMPGRAKYQGMLDEVSKRLKKK